MAESDSRPREASLYRLLGRVPRHPNGPGETEGTRQIETVDNDCSLELLTAFLGTAT